MLKPTRVSVPPQWLCGECYSTCGYDHRTLSFASSTCWLQDGASDEMVAAIVAGYVLRDWARNRARSARMAEYEDAHARPSRDRAETVAGGFWGW